MKNPVAEAPLSEIKPIERKPEPVAEVETLFDLNPEGSFTIRKDEKKFEAERQERSAKTDIKRPKPKTADSSEPISNWFTRQFGTLFTENDAEIDQ